MCIVDIPRKLAILNLLTSDVHSAGDRLHAPRSPLRAKLSGRNVRLGHRLLFLGLAV